MFLKTIHLPFDDNPMMANLQLRDLFELSTDNKCYDLQSLYHLYQTVCQETQSGQLWSTINHFSRQFSIDFPTIRDFHKKKSKTIHGTRYSFREVYDLTLSLLHFK